MAIGFLHVALVLLLSLTSVCDIIIFSSFPCNIIYPLKKKISSFSTCTSVINALCTFHKQTVARSAVTFNEDISKNFVDGDKGKALSKESGKPLMVIVTQPWCGACKGLKRSLNNADSDKLQGASRNIHFPQSQASASIHTHSSTMLL